MTHIGYKLVSVKKKKRISAFIRGKGAHVYREGRWTEPKKGCGPLCVLTDRWQAMNHNLKGRYEVWQCEFEKTRFRSVWFPKAKSSLGSLINGTTLASRVKLIKLEDAYINTGDR